jgi:hypothetical protein
MTLRGEIFAALAHQARGPLGLSLMIDRLEQVFVERASVAAREGMLAAGTLPESASSEEQRAKYREIAERVMG